MDTPVEDIGGGNHDAVHAIWAEIEVPVSHDPVNHPSHYTSDKSGVECIQITRHRNFNVGNAIKYLWRAGLKDDKKVIEDLRKAIWYINDEIQRLEATFASEKPVAKDLPRGMTPQQMFPDLRKAPQ